MLPSRFWNRDGGTLEASSKVQPFASPHRSRNQQASRKAYPIPCSSAGREASSVSLLTVRSRDQVDGLRHVGSRTGHYRWCVVRRRDPRSRSSWHRQCGRARWEGRRHWCLIRATVSSEPVSVSAKDSTRTLGSKVLSAGLHCSHDGDVTVPDPSIENYLKDFCLGGRACPKYTKVGEFSS